MDIQTEKLIVNAFIADRKKERVLYELSKPDKRWGCVLKLEHYIDTRFCFEIKEKISSCEQVYDILKKYKISQECYVISLDEDDGKYMELSAALESCVFFGPFLISLVHGKVAYFEGEQSYGAPSRYLLIKD